MSTSATIHDIQYVDFPAHTSDEASLYVYEHNDQVPFAIARVFTVDAKQACQRGAHAHKECQQLLVSMKGKIKVTVDDANETVTILLDRPDKGLLITPGLWAEQEYELGSLLMVLTDLPYDEGDYFRTYVDFKAYKKA
tara:strand:- start:11369 stop:11782 length:414 start_codon:yes stop_codon:yes gene_type:complete